MFFFFCFASFAPYKYGTFISTSSPFLMPIHLVLLFCFRFVVVCSLCFVILRISFRKIVIKCHTHGRFVCFLVNFSEETRICIYNSICFFLYLCLSMCCRLCSFKRRYRYERKFWIPRIIIACGRMSTVYSSFHRELRIGTTCTLLVLHIFIWIR